MSNILPREAQKTIWRIYLGRFVIAGSCVALLAALLAAFALLPMYIVLHSGQSSTQATLERKTSEIQSERAEVARTVALLSTLSPFVSATTTPSDVIEAALALRPKGVSVDHIVYSSGLKGEMMIVGSAGTRDDINAYQQALQADPNFETASVPVNNLVGSQGGRFSITLTGAF